MDGLLQNTGFGLSGGMLGRLMPMALVVDGSGLIRMAGPTLVRLHRGAALAGQAFFDMFRLIRPEAGHTLSDLADLAGRRLTLRMSNPEGTVLRAIAVPLADDAGLLINMSFGIRVAEAVRDHGLTHADFAPTDLTVELLYLTEVKAAVTGEMTALNRRLREAQERSQRQAMTDPLTGLANRRAFDEALSRAVAGAGRGLPFALMHLDLDRFKAVNDTLGHAAGDVVIGAVADVLRAEVRLQDIAARVGGDEFMLVLAGSHDAERIMALARRIIDRLEQPIPCGGDLARISASLGAALSQTYDLPDAAAMTADADEALYASKRNGRGRCTIHAPNSAGP
jgi:diguanylate cyclase (GGDEF)-like protein